MNSSEIDAQQLLQAVESLRQEVAQLSQRLEAYEQSLPRPGAAAPAPAPAPARHDPQAERLSDDLVLVISAAVAAYLGVKPHIRQIRLVRSSAWAQFGRMTVQASHALTIQHG
jgi:methylmalonyl-CoA carboxyltransferase large subunit